MKDKASKVFKAADFAAHIGDVLFARKRNLHEFSAKLIEVREDEDQLLFQTRSGSVIVDQASSIIYFVVVEPKEVG